jgi:hypothetical protein
VAMISSVKTNRKNILVIKVPVLSGIPGAAY